MKTAEITKTETQDVKPIEKSLTWGNGVTRVTNPEDVKCLWELGYRSLGDDGDNKMETLQKYLDEVEKYGDVYLEINN